MLKRVRKFSELYAAILQRKIQRHIGMRLRSIFPFRTELKIDQALRFKRSREGLSTIRQCSKELFVNGNIRGRNSNEPHRMRIGFCANSAVAYSVSVRRKGC